MRPTIRFIRRGRLVELVDVPPTMLLLDYLRENEGSTGTKEGCGEGDCGACTVALGRLRDGKLAYEPVNACIQFLGQVDGAEVVTVEDLVQPAARSIPCNWRWSRTTPRSAASARRASSWRSSPSTRRPTAR